MTDKLEKKVITTTEMNESIQKAKEKNSVLGFVVEKYYQVFHGYETKTKVNKMASEVFDSSMKSVEAHPDYKEIYPKI